MKRLFMMITMIMGVITYADTKSDFESAMRFLPEVATELERQERATQRKMVSFAVVGICVAGWFAYSKIKEEKNNG